MIATSLVATYAAVWARIPVPTITILTLSLVLTLLWFLEGRVRVFSTPLRRALGWVGIVALVLPALVTAAAVSSYVVNSWRLSVFADQILSRAPDGAEIELKSAKIGVLTGNGNHCDFIIEALVRTELPEIAVLRHFETLPIARAIPGETSEIHVEISQTGPRNFLVRVTDAPNDRALDPRCT